MNEHDIRDAIDKLYEDAGFTKTDKLSELALMTAVTLLNVGSDNCVVKCGGYEISIDVRASEVE